MAAPGLDYYTAKPILALLLAQQELEEPDLDPETCLHVFRDFLALPYDGKDDGGAFRAYLTAEGPDGGTLAVSLARRVHGPPAYVDIGRAVRERDVGIRWDYILEDVGSLRSELVWARDYPDPTAFVAAVATTPAWRFTCRTPTEATVFAREVGEDLW